MSCPPFHVPPTALQVADVMYSLVLLISSLASASCIKAHCPPVKRNMVSMSGGPKNHCVTNTQYVVITAYLSNAFILLFVTPLPKPGWKVRNMANATVVQNQPTLTKYTLKTFFFCAK
jgi:hypothetical protein